MNTIIELLQTLSGKRLLGAGTFIFIMTAISIYGICYIVESICEVKIEKNKNLKNKPDEKK